MEFGLKILHIDDHTLFAEGLSALMTQHSDELCMVSATSADQALKILDDNQEIDLILIDLKMPGLDGLAFIESLNQRDLFIPFIVLSASEDLFHIRRALNEGASGFIPKTYTAQQILEVISDVMAGNIYVPQNIEESIATLPEQEPQQDQHKIMSNYKLGQRQMDVLKLMQQGYSNDEIAQVLNLSKNTIKTHARTLFTSFQVSNRLECVRYAERIGLLE